MREDKLIKDNSYIGQSTNMSKQQNNMSKETILKEFDELIGEAPEMVKMSEIIGKNVCFVCGQPFNKSIQAEKIRNLFIKAIDQTKKETREETIMEILNNFVEEIGYKSIKCQELTLEPEEVYNLINNKLKK